MAKKIEFHKGDFFKGDELLASNDGNTEFYWHLYNQIKGLGGKSGLGSYGKMKHITSELTTVKRALNVLEKKIEKVKLFDTKYRIKDVKWSSHYDK